MKAQVVADHQDMIGLDPVPLLSHADDGLLYQHRLLALHDAVHVAWGRAGYDKSISPVNNLISVGRVWANPWIKSPNLAAKLPKVPAVSAADASHAEDADLWFLVSAFYPIA